ncbi:MAG: hypothetical protein ABSD10_02760 [Candidatus Saccharimonadales bacterium]
MPPTQQIHQPHPAPMPVRRKHIDWAARTIRLELFTVIVGSALLLAAVSLYLAFSGTTGSETKLVNTSKYQAVFLNGGVTSGSVSYSTYFGHVAKLTSSYMVLDNVYYLTDTSTTTSTSNPQLVKLGCQQLHSPYDQMVINRSQVAFWENLQDSGKVVQAIQQYIKQNPNGPNCSQSTNSSSQSTTTPQSSSSSSNATSGQ